MLHSNTSYHYCYIFQTKLLENLFIFFFLVVSQLCDFRPGDTVLVLFTSFAGTDPNSLLLQSASESQIRVYLGLPSAPQYVWQWGQLIPEAMPAYYELVLRILEDHAHRYGGKARQDIQKHPQRFEMQANRRQGLPRLYDTIAGYYGMDELCLAEYGNSVMRRSQKVYPYAELYGRLGTLVHAFGRMFAVSPYIVLNRSQANYSLDNHVSGFEVMASSGHVDIIAVQEGRGCAKGSYFWPHEADKAVETVDPGLARIVRFLDPSVREGFTYRQQFSGSNQEVRLSLVFAN